MTKDSKEQQVSSKSQEQQEQQNGKRTWNVQWEGLTVGLDVGDKYSHYCVINEEAEVVERGKVKTQGKALREYFQRQPARTRVGLEVGTHSGWISRKLGELHLEVLVGQPRRMPQIYRTGRKNDRVDAEKLARMARLDPNAMAPIQHRSAEAQADLALVRARDAMVRARSNLINVARTLVKGTGQRWPACSAPSFHRRAGEGMPPELRQGLQPVIGQIGLLTQQVGRYDRELEQLGKQKYPATQRLRQVSGVGPVTSLAYVLTLADAKRFERSRQVGAYLGLVPRQDASGESQRQLGITKAGNCYLRRLLVDSAHYILGPFGPDTDLRRWGLQLASQGGKNGKKRAVVAVARKLAILLHHLWVSGEDYEPLRQNAAPTPAAAAAK